MAAPELRSREGRSGCISDSFASPSLPGNMLAPQLAAYAASLRTGNPIYYIGVHTSVSRFYRDIDIAGAEAKGGGLSPKPSSEGMPRINRLVLLDTPVRSVRLLITTCPVVHATKGTATPRPAIPLEQ